MTPEDIARLVDDCQVLLGYVTRLPDTRLDWCFEDTRAAIAGSPPARVAMPPMATRQKAQFLERLVALSEPQAAPAMAATDIAFLIATRDFLAALAYPATVASIRITDEYNRTGGLGRFWSRIAALWSTAPPPDPLGNGAASARRFGRAMASRVALAQVLVLGLVVLTVMTSVYALVGRGLLLEVKANEAFFTQLSADIETAEKTDRAVFRIFQGAAEDPPRGGEMFSVRRYCEVVERRREGADKDGFVTAQQQRLCDRHDGHNSLTARLYARLQDWHGAVVRMPGTTDTWRQRPEGGALIADAGGAITPAAAPDASAPTLAAVQWLRLEVATATVVLQAITEYVLPCLYAMLGALAAALRHIARRAEETTLDFSDGGTIPRTLVLGVLFGAVIGLFASQFGAGSAAGDSTIASLTPAAISLLAGYSVARVFEFLDGLSLRVFGTRPPAAQG